MLAGKENAAGGASEKVAAHIGQISGTVQERLAGIALVKTYSAEQRESDRWERDNEEHYNRVVAQSDIAHTVGAISEGLVHTGTTIVIGFGGYLAMKGEMTAGDLTKFLGYLGIMYGPVRHFADLNVVYQTSRAAMERVFRVFDIRPRVAERADAIRQTPSRGEVTFEHVSFRYDDASDGFLCVCPQDNEFHTCDHRTQIDGSVVFVTSAFGMNAAGVVVRRLAATR